MPFLVVLRVSQYNRKGNHNSGIKILAPRHVVELKEKYIYKIFVCNMSEQMNPESVKKTFCSLSPNGQGFKKYSL